MLASGPIETGFDIPGTLCLYRSNKNMLPLLFFIYIDHPSCATVFIEVGIT
jgi:hypothetical protein